MEGSLMTEAQSKIRISVRNLVEFVLRSGDLDNRRSQGGKKEAMQAGSRLHRKIQKRMGADYRSEVALKHQVREDEFSILLEGRADGIITETSGIVIDEIKCIYMDVERLEEPDPVHLAQALCYGYMYASEQDLDSVGIQLTYCNIETEQIRRFRQAKTREELEEWFQGLIHEYVKWARYLYHHSIRRTVSLCIQGRSERTGGFCIQKYCQREKSLHTGAYRDRKNLILCLSKPESYRRRLWGKAVLSHSQDYY